MKIRNGFVTNSSSSSFIVSTNKKAGELLLNFIHDLAEINNYPIRSCDDITFDLFNGKMWYGAHLELIKKAEEKDQSLMGKKFYDLCIERSSDFVDMVNFLDEIDGVKIESRDSY